MRLTVLGCGDAFATGGRLNACFLVEAGRTTVLLDCGATSLVALRRAGVEPNQIQAALISHLHGDHFGGLPFFILEAQLISRRTAPLTLVGPVGLAERLTAALEVLFPGSSTAKRKFEILIQELCPGQPTEVAGLTVTGFEGIHPSGAPALALRVEAEGRTLAYSGDTAWTENLLPAAQGADLFLTEAYGKDRQVPNHLDLATLVRHLPRLGVKRVLLTHLGPEMLTRLDQVDLPVAEEGLRVEV